MPTHAIIKQNQPQPVAVYETITILTDAQTKASPTTSIELVPAPGAGKILNYLTGVWSKKGGPNYGNISGDAELAVIYDGGTYASLKALEATSEVSNILSTPNISFFPARTLTDGALINPNINNPTADLENKSLKFFAFNSGGDFTGGDAANTLTIATLYTISDI